MAPTDSPLDAAVAGALAAPDEPVVSPEDAAEARIAAYYDADRDDDDLDDDDDDGDDADDMPYRDAKKLRAELKADRERWRPYEETFGGLNEQDAAALRHAATLLQTDPKAAAALFAKFAEVLTPAEQAAVDQAVADAGGDDDRPLTAAEVDARLDARLAAERSETEIERHKIAMLAEIRELGYDPDSEDEDEQLRFQQLVAVAGTLDGDIAGAHERLERQVQKAIDSYLDGKRADARRPTSGAAQGTGPSEQRVLESMADAEAAANARLDAAFGVQPSRRR